MDNKSCIEQQVKNKIKDYNRQRTSTAIPICILTAMLLLSPVLGNEAFSIRFSVLCSALLMLFSLFFVLSSRNTILLFFITTNVVVALLVFKQIHFESFLILTLINVGTLLISRKFASAFTQSATNEIEALNRLKIEATTDCLTQFLNRNGLEQAVSTTWALCKREKKNVGFLLTDIDYFKSYNDTLGHLEGDNILMQVADSIRMCFKRETDIIGRIGGDEFLIFLPDIDDDHIVKMAQLLSLTLTDLKIKAYADSPFDYLSVSIGVATGIPQASDSLTDFFNHADRALYHAKRNGRNCISYNRIIIKNFSEHSHSNTVDGVSATADLRTGFVCEDSKS